MGERVRVLACSLAVSLVFGLRDLFGLSLPVLSWGSLLAHLWALQCLYLRPNLVPLCQFTGVIGEDDHPFLLGRHAAG